MAATISRLPQTKNEVLRDQVQQVLRQIKLKLSHRKTHGIRQLLWEHLKSIQPGSKTRLSLLSKIEIELVNTESGWEECELRSWEATMGPFTSQRFTVPLRVVIGQRKSSTSFCQNPRENG